MRDGGALLNSKFRPKGRRYEKPLGTGLFSNLFREGINHADPRPFCSARSYRFLARSLAVSATDFAIGAGFVH